MQSETIGALAAALAKAQGAIKPAPMDRDNPFFKSKYATLTSLWESARAALAANGLAVTQATDFDNDGKIVLVTTLMHSSGEWIGSVYPVDPVDRKPQSLGSAITYARRYAFGALVGLSSDDDDDGNAGNGNGAQQSATNAVQPSRKKEAPPQSNPAPTVTVTTTGNGGGAGNGGGNGNGHKARWASAADAYAWAVEAGACENEFEARSSMKKIVAAQFGGRLTGDNMAAVFEAFHARQMEKLHERANAAAEDAPELEPDALETPA